MNHLDLFSGIGGFAIAVDEVFPESEHIFCDNDKFCQAVLKKHWPQSKIYGDIRALHADGFNTNSHSDRCTNGEKEINPTKTNEQTLDNPKKHYGKINIASNSTDRGCRQAESDENKKGLQARPEQAGKLEGGFERPRGAIDIITGGFPCQPFSQAGKRNGTNDDRHLWPEMLRVIQEFKPTWVIAENVRGLLTLQQGVVFEQVCLDLEASGYEVQPLIIPAVAVNAPHRRDRVWFIAHRSCERIRGIASEECVIQKRIVVESESKGGAVRSESQGRASEQDVADSEVKGGQCRESAQLQEKLSGRNDSGGWDRSWIEVAGYFLRVDDGISSWVDRFINEIITKENYAIIKNRAKDLQILWKAIQEKQIQERVGGILKISEKGLLLSFLCCLQKKSIKKSFEMESEKINSINELRNLWNNAGFRRSSQGRKLYEQQARELIGIMPKLPYDLAQSISQTWYFLIGSYNATYAQPVELGEIKLTAPGHRNAQLKAYGNAIVPQVAIEILKAIKESICI